MELFDSLYFAVLNCLGDEFCMLSIDQILRQVCW